VVDRPSFEQEVVGGSLVVPEVLKVDLPIGSNAIIETISLLELDSQRPDEEVWQWV
jgi:hypothetical protein